MTIGSVTNTAGSLGTTGSQSSTLDQNAFLKLMTTQLQTQDPFNPVDNTQMVAQLAQFSSLAGITEMNSKLATIASDVSGSRVGDAAGWIGRKALIESDSATALPDGSYAGMVALPSNAANVTISLIDENGATVNTQTLGAHDAGTVNFSWDGKDASGNVAATGKLKMVVTATDANGAAITAQTASWASISGVQSPASGQTLLVTPLGMVDPTTAVQLG